MEELNFEIISHLGELTHYQTGWTKEINIVKWGVPNVPKFDIRDWSPDHTRMSKGITLHTEEMEKLYEILKERFEKEE